MYVSLHFNKNTKQIDYRSKYCNIDDIFPLYIFPSDSQESDGGAKHRVSNYSHLFPEMTRYAVWLNFFLFLSFL